MNRHSSRLALFIALATILGACGTRTPLTIDLDGSVTSSPDGALDLGRRDLGGAMPIDFGPPPPPPPPPPGCTSDRECSDGIGCNGAERCEATLCVAGEPLLCDDGVDCTDDVCVEVEPDLGACVSTPVAEACADGELCTASGCEARACMADEECDDRFVCTGTERCVDNRCVVAFRMDCNDGNICTTDRCIESLGCRSTDRDDDRDGAADAACGGTDCDDGNPRIRPGISEVCGDGVDNNCDGAADCADRACVGRPPCGPPPPFDMGPIDFGSIDFGSSSREIGIAACTNGFDDDADGRLDCADNDCSGFGPGGECCNGVDDTPGDDDPNFDLFACRCFGDADCAGVGSIETSCWSRSFSLCGPRCNFVGGNTFCREFFPGSFERCDAASGECVE